MENLYIVGAGGFGREISLILNVIERIKGKRWNVMGFLDDTENPLAGKKSGLKVVGTIRDFYPKPDDALVMGIADPKAKQRLAAMLKSRGAKFASVIHPYAYLGEYNEIGEGVVIYGGFSMSVNCKIGSFTSLLSSSLGHDSSIGDFTTISAQCNIMGATSIGQRVFLGGNVAVAPKVNIGDDAYICVGSVLVRDVPKGAKMLGNPAREIG